MTDRHSTSYAIRVAYAFAQRVDHGVSWDQLEAHRPDDVEPEVWRADIEALFDHLHEDEAHPR